MKNPRSFAWSWRSLGGLVCGLSGLFAGFVGVHAPLTVQRLGTRVEVTAELLAPHVWSLDGGSAGQMLALLETSGDFQSLRITHPDGLDFVATQAAEDPLIYLLGCDWSPSSGPFVTKAR
jgi:hypothetical protein